MGDCPHPEKQGRYATKKDAWRHVNKLRAKDGAIDVKPYLCRCGLWHVGHDAVAFRRRVRSALRAADRRAGRR